MFHTGFQSSVQLMLITTVFLFSLNSECVCVSLAASPVYIFWSVSLFPSAFFPPPPPSLLLVTASTPCYDDITLFGLLCPFRPGINHIWQSGGAIPKVQKPWWWESDRELQGETERDGGSASSMLEALTVCRVQCINCVSVFDFGVIWSQSNA